MGEYKKEFAFDLKTDRYSPLYNYYDYLSAAYKDIKEFMEDNGFEWRQGSVYISKASLSNKQVRNIIVKLCQELPWLSECLNKFDVTNIGRQHDLLSDIKETCEIFEDDRLAWIEKVEDERNQQER